MKAAIDPRLEWLENYDELGERTGKRPFAAWRGAVTFGAAAEIDLVPASSVLAGADRDKHCDADRKVGEALRLPGALTPGSGAFDALVNAFGASPLTGCTSVLDLALRSSEWNPVDPRQAGNHEAFRRYVSIVAGTPFFDRPLLRQHPIPAPPNDPAGIVRDVAQIVPDISGEDRARIAKNITILAHSVFGGGDHQHAEMAMFVQHAVNAATPAIAVHLYWCSAEMRYDCTRSKTTVSVSSQSVFCVEHVSVEFRAADWGRYAAEVARRQVTSVEEWLRKTRSHT